jgi:hypothetical protein
MAGVLAAVHHAEVVAHRIGEPYGTLVLYGTFVLVQAVRHRDYFLPAEAVADEEVHAPPLACLGAVVMLAKALAPTSELAVAFVSLATGWTLTLGLDVKSTVLLLLSLFVATLSLGTGRTTVLQGTVHLVISPPTFSFRWCPRKRCLHSEDKSPNHGQVNGFRQAQADRVTDKPSGQREGPGRGLDPHHRRACFVGHGRATGDVCGNRSGLSRNRLDETAGLAV